MSHPTPRDPAGRIHVTRILLATLLVPVLADPARADETTIELANGDKVTGELVSRSDEEIVIEHPVFGRLVIPAREEKGAVPTPGLFGTSFLEGWTRSVNVGVNGSRGNSDSTSILLGLDLDEKSDTRRWRIDGNYKLSATGSERDEHNALLETRRDWLFPGKRWFAFAGGGYRYDEFENWQHRIMAQGGPGYHIRKEGPFRLDVLGGPHLVYEFGDKNELRPEIMLGVEAAWDISEGHSLTLSNFVHQQLNDDEYRNVTRLEWHMRVMDSEHLGLSLGLDNEYDSAAEPDRNNLKYWTALTYHY